VDASLVALASAIAQLGVAGVVIVGFLLMVQGVLRPGKLVDSERDRILLERDKRETEISAQRDRREAQLIAERDAWRDRSLATDERLDRVAAAFERLAKAPAPQ
jgi:hypothetical protein